MQNNIENGSRLNEINFCNEVNEDEIFTKREIERLKNKFKFIGLDNHNISIYNNNICNNILSELQINSNSNSSKLNNPLLSNKIDLLYSSNPNFENFNKNNNNDNTTKGKYNYKCTKRKERDSINNYNSNVNTILNIIHNNYNQMVEFDSFDNSQNSLTICKNEYYCINNNNANNKKSNKINNNNNNNNMFCFFPTRNQKVYKFIASENESAISKETGLSTTNELISKNTNNKDMNNSSKFKKHLKKTLIKCIPKLTDYSMYTLLYFVYENYNILIDKLNCKSNNILSNKILSSLNNLFNPLITSFKYQYTKNLELIEYYFKYSQFKKGKYIYPLLDLYIKTQIKKDSYNKSYTLKFSYATIEKNNIKKEYISSIKFDVIKNANNSNNYLWIVSEIDEDKDDIKRISYFKPILSYKENDLLYFKINIFSVCGKLDPYSFKWFDIEVNDYINKKLIENTLYNSNNLNPKEKLFVNMRSCEIENYINFWKNCQLLTNQTLIKTFHEIFEKCFNIFEEYYDFNKVFIYKFKMKANKTGIITRNIYVNYDIIIKNTNEFIENESNYLGLLNTMSSQYDYKNSIINQIQLRLNDYVTVYLTDYYK